MEFGDVILMQVHRYEGADFFRLTDSEDLVDTELVWNYAVFLESWRHGLAYVDMQGRNGSMDPSYAMDLKPSMVLASEFGSIPAFAKGWALGKFGLKALVEPEHPGHALAKRLEREILFMNSGTVILSGGSKIKSGFAARQSSKERLLDYARHYRDAYMAVPEADMLLGALLSLEEKIPAEAGTGGG